MNKNIMKILTFVLLCTELIVISHVLISRYNKVMNGSLLVMPILACLSFIVIFFKRCNNKKQIMRLVICSLLVLIIVPIILFCYKPKYTYTEAQNIIYKTEYKDKKVKFIDTKGNIAVENPPNIFLRNAYVIKVNENNKITEYIFNPTNGSYHKWNH